jgi:hypothetical protein
MARPQGTMSCLLFPSKILKNKLFKLKIVEYRFVFAKD